MDRLKMQLKSPLYFSATTLPPCHAHTSNTFRTINTGRVPSQHYSDISPSKTHQQGSWLVNLETWDTHTHTSLCISDLYRLFLMSAHLIWILGTCEVIAGQRWTHVDLFFLSYLLVLPFVLFYFPLISLRARLEELRMFLENETWELCPVKSNFNIAQLHVSNTQVPPGENGGTR